MSKTQSSNAEPHRERRPRPQPDGTLDADRAALRSGAALRALLQKRPRGSESSKQSAQSERSEPVERPEQLRPSGQPLDLRPGCVYGVVTRERVDDLTNELREIKARLNYLFSLVAGAIIVDILLRISGLG